IARQVESPPSRLLATIENNLGATLLYAGQHQEAMVFMNDALNNWRGLGQENSSSAITIMTNLASLLHQQGELDRAEALYREAIDRRLQRFGESGALGAAYLNLGTLLTQRYQLDSAGEHVQQGVDLIVRFEGENTVNQARGLLVRSRWYQAAGEYQAAHADITNAIDMFEQTLGAEHLFSRVAQTQQALLLAHAAQHDYDQLQQLSALPVREQLQAVIAQLSALQPQSNRFLAQAQCAKARYELTQANPQRALELAVHCVELRTALTADSSWELADAQAIAAAARLQLGMAQAEDQLQQARQRLLTTLGVKHPKVVWCDRWLRAGEAEVQS
ncbi:MAG: tetratricopeptide repeat protein, partial [Pseudomonadota bacterium]